MSKSKKENKTLKPKTLDQKSNEVIPSIDPKLQNKLIQRIENGRNALNSDFINDYLESTNMPDLIEQYYKFNINERSQLIDVLISTGVVFGIISQDRSSKEFCKLLIPMRDAIIQEYNIENLSELMLVDAAIINYNRFLTYQTWIGGILGKKGGIADKDPQIAQRFASMAQVSIDQFVNLLTSLKRLASLPQGINIKGSQINIGKNQQILNNNPDTIPAQNSNDFGSSDKKKIK